MDRTIENVFFELYREGGIVCTVVDALVNKYDLGHQKGTYDNAPLQGWQRIIIEKKIKSVDNSLLIDLESMFSEIENNLLECKDDTAKDNYCIELLMPFAKYLNTVNPKYLDKERTLEVENGFFSILHKESDFYSIEGYFRKIVQMFIIYADWLDWIFLKNGIDLQVIQKECGVYLKSPGRFAHHYLQWAGTIENAQRFIDALPKETQQELPKETQQELEIVLPSELSTDKAKRLFKKAIQAGFMDNSYKFVGTWYQAAYFAEGAAEYLDLKCKWKPFIDLWGYDKLAQTRRESKERFGCVKGQDDIDKLFD